MKIHGGRLPEPWPSLRGPRLPCTAIRMAAAMLYVRLGNFPAARIHYAEAVKLEPKNARALASGSPKKLV